MGRSLTTVASLLVILVGCTHVHGACPLGYSQVDRHCFKVALDYLTAETTFTYDEAKALCQKSTSSSGWTSNLVVLENSEKLQALGKHIFEGLPEPMSGLVFWVGGEKLDSDWKWVTGGDLNLMSHIWLPQQPRPFETNMRMYLVPADRINKRLYATSYNYSKPGILPSYVCEATQQFL